MIVVQLVTHHKSNMLPIGLCHLLGFSFAIDIRVQKKYQGFLAYKNCTDLGALKNTNEILLGCSILGGYGSTSSYFYFFN